MCKRIKIGRWIMAVAMAAVLVLQVCMVTGAAASDSDGATASISDPATLLGWQEYFGEDVEDTAYVGRIWTDKTVLTGDLTLPSSGVTVSRSDPSHFLSVLSGISSYKNIIGQSTIPIDVMLVLDISGSMREEDTVQAMVQATNVSMQNLQDLNIHNRVGIVLYSGNAQVGDSTPATAQVLLPLGRYRAQGDTFITYSQQNTVYRIHSANGLQTQAGQALPPKTVVVEGGTYTQNGIFTAMQQFEAADNIDVDGTRRMPVMVLMSDGAPTAGTTAYTQVATSHMGNGTTTSAGVAFTTQLTAAHARARMEEKYGRSPLVYTLGLGFEKLAESDKFIAMSVLNTQHSTQTLAEYWRTFRGLNAGQSMSIQYYNNAAQSNTTQLMRRANDKIADIHYVDQYFAAENADDLRDAFENIVEEIVIQSRYYPTQISGENVDLSGYLVFNDAIGNYMQVKKINGITLNQQLHAGETFSRILSEAYDAGTQELDLENSYAFAFVRSLEERLNIDRTQAIQLVLNSFANGQIYYNDNEDFSNAILWYGAADGGYIGPAAAGQPAPATATTLNRSYSYFGESGAWGSGAKLMYVGVRVQTNLATGREVVQLSIPASLVPMTEYNVLIDVDDLEKAETAVVTREGVEPLRLFYEIGLQEGIDASTVRDKVAPDYAHSGPGNLYRFYTNDWSADSAKTTADYTPSTENEFYNYPRNTTIYKETAAGVFEALTTAPVDGGSYFYKEQLFSAKHFGQKSDVKQIYQPIAPAVLAQAKQRENGTYYIPKGVPKVSHREYTIEKTENRTETYPHAAEPQMVEQGEVVSARVLLGNNGRLQLLATEIPQSKTGDLKVRKTVTGSQQDGDKAFDFTVTLGDRTLDGRYGDMLFRDGVATLSLRHAQSATATGLPAGMAYTVLEKDYRAEGYRTTHGQASGNIVADGETTVEFFNEKAVVVVPEPEPGKPSGKKHPPGTVTVPGTPAEPTVELEDTLPPLEEMPPGDNPLTGAPTKGWTLLTLLSIGVCAGCVRWWLKEREEQ